MRVLQFLFVLFLLSMAGCVKTTQKTKLMVVTTYQYNDVWILDCLSKPEADSIIKVVSAQTAQPVLKISYSARDLMKLNKDRNYKLSCNRLDVLTAEQRVPQAASGTAYEVEKANGVWVVKGTYKWSR
ncbi:MAG TPA: hypothetical protein VLX68_17530 [Chitinivibrionales bacterium]|nr:hypothetical protein [Chitinivibrionales bacterium]